MGWNILMLLMIILAGIGSACAYDWEWQNGANVKYEYVNLTTLSFTSIGYSVIDSGTINVGDTITRDYIIDNASGLTPGGAHLKMVCYKQGDDTIIEVTVWTDNYTTSSATAIINGYFFGGTLGIDGDYKGFNSIYPDESKTSYLTIGKGWSESPPPIQTPIPPLAIILVLMTIPAIVLRKITK